MTIDISRGTEPRRDFVRLSMRCPFLPPVSAYRSEVVFPTTAFDTQPAHRPRRPTQEARMFSVKRILIVAVPILTVAAIALATPSSGFTTVLLARSSLAERLKIQTHPSEITDIVVQSVAIEPGGQSGWHYHPGPILVAVKAGTITLYDGDDPSCTPRQVSAGAAFIEQPGHVHLARNDGPVAEQHVSTYILPLGAPTRVDAPNPGNCPF
jgi:quercetin dioxygenase-like cupin family protein